MPDIQFADDVVSHSPLPRPVYPFRETYEDSASSIAHHLLQQSFEFAPDIRFVLNKDNSVEFANLLGRQMLKDGGLCLNGMRQLRFRSGRAQASFDEALANTRRDLKKRHHKIIAVEDGEWTSLYVRCLDLDTGHLEVAIRPTDQHLDIGSVAEAFGLTAMETKVLLGLVRSLCPKKIAISNNISVHTVRAHIRGIYAKLGTRSGTATQSLVLRLID